MLAGGGGQDAVGQVDVVQGVIDQAGGVRVAGSALVTVPPLMFSVGTLVALKAVAVALGAMNSSTAPALTVTVRLLLAMPSTVSLPRPRRPPRASRR